VQLESVAGAWRDASSLATATTRIPAPQQENAFNYDKGVLAEILEPIMGKGLIPADLETWKVGGGAHAACRASSCSMQQHAAWGMHVCVSFNPMQTSPCVHARRRQPHAPRPTNPHAPPTPSRQNAQLRRRAVVPAFHKQYYEAMVNMFGRCTQQTVDKLDALLAGSNGRWAWMQRRRRRCCAVGQGGRQRPFWGAVLGEGGVGRRQRRAPGRHSSHLLSFPPPCSPVVVNMETEFLNLGLDIIGLGVRLWGRGDERACHV
jgi:hypothetical protein